MKKLLVLIGVSIILVSNAYAAPAAMKLCYSNFNGNMTVRSRCAKGEVQLSGYNIGSLGLQGQAGTVDPNKCVKRESYASGSNIVSTTAACLIDEFALNSSCSSIGIEPYLISEKLDGGGNSQLPKMYSVLTCTMGELSGTPHMVTAHLICCKP